MKSNRLFRKINGFLIAFAVFSFSAFWLSGCNDAVESALVNSAEGSGTNGSGGTQGTDSSGENGGVLATDSAATLRLGMNVETASRTALPSVGLEDITYIFLSYQGTGSQGSIDDLEIVDGWESISDMENAVIPFKIGEYNFTIIVVTKGMMFTEKKTFTIVKGVNRLSFSPRLEVLSDEFNGKGDLNVKIRFDGENVKKVTGGLYSTEGPRIPGYGDEELEVTGGGNCAYEKKGVPGGNYIVVFKFFADDEKTKLLSTYKEYASIVNGFESSSECVMQTMGKLFNINYELNEGHFSGNFTAPGTYTRQTAKIALPTQENVTRTGYDFAGWYDNEEFLGEPLVYLDSGNTGDKVFYAKWLKKVNVILNPNGGSFSDSVPAKTQEVYEGAETSLKAAADLGLVAPAGKRFLGWDENAAWKYSAENPEPKYSDGGAITTDKNVALYAIWALGLNPEGEGDNTDTDKDGLTDYEELTIYHTNPESADTDGDGWSDGKEIKEMYVKNTNDFNPLIADTPSLKVIFAGKPNIEYKFSSGTTHNDSEVVNYTEGSTGSNSNTNSNTKSESTTKSGSIKIGFSEKWGEKGFEFGMSQDFTGTISDTEGDNYTFSQQSSEGWSRTWQNGRTTGTSTSQTVSGGVISIPLKLQNTGTIAYSIKSVAISVSRIPNNCAYDAVPVATKSFSDIGVIAPGTESGVYNLSMDLTVGETEKLLKWSNGLKIDVAGYSITMSSNDFTEALTQVKSKTAEVYIDWGNESTRKARSYKVAVKNQYNKNATTINDLFTESDLKYVFDNILNFKQNPAAGVDGYELTETGNLKSICGITNKDDKKEGIWYIVHTYMKNGQPWTHIYVPYAENAEESAKWKLSDIKINAGDKVSVIYSIDRDGDGVPLNEELINGSSDSKVDTDGDGLSDFEEIYGWYKNTLVSSYSDTETGRAYTNPVVADSDGDDIPDADDTDPLVPKAKNDTRLGTSKFSDYMGGTFKDISFNSNGEATISDLYEYIYLDITPKIAFATVEYMVKDAKDASYAEIDKNKGIKLNVGNNEIYVKCTAPDGTEKIYTIHAKSKFRELRRFSVSSRKLGGGKTSFVWDSYSDERAEASDGGYVLQIRKGSKAPDTVLTRAEAMEASDSTSDFTTISEVLYKVSAAALLKGGLSLGLQPNSKYFFYLYAYAQSDKNDTYESTLLSSVEGISTGVNEQGTLTFYAHYIYDYEDQDGGYDPEYYWSFNCNDLNLSVLNIGSGDKKEFDDDDDKTYCFGESRIHKYGNDPAKFSNCTKKITKTFSRTRDYTFNASWTATEYDRSSSDDNLGTVRATFSYSSATDTWTCTWASDHGKSDESSIKTGERSGKQNGSHSDGNRWELHNSSEGEIEFHWDWGWE